MSDLTPPAAPGAPARQSVWQNWISLAGAIITAGSLFAFLFLLTLDLAGKGERNPYLGILCYLVAPAFLILGIALVLGGAWQQHRLRTRTPDGPAPRLAIDLARPHDRWLLIWFSVGTVAFLLLTSVGSYQTFHYTESVEFCGEVCHKVMQPEFTTYQAGAHARVACVECHIGSGAAWYVKAKVSGLYQVYSVLFHKYEQPIPTPVQNLRPARDTCERCHWPEKYSGSIEVTHHRFLADEENTPYTVRLLVHVGGGSAAHGPVGGIHWHMLVSNKVEYYAADLRRQTIPWIKVTSPDGSVKVFRTDDFKGEPDPKAVRQMDCMDCHNRPAHNYSSPNDSVDEALYLNRIDRTLPGVKRAVVDLLTKTYANEEAATAAIDKGLRQRYAGKPGLDATIVAAQRIYRVNFFPEMKADWSKYPNNIGHLDSDGCFRCHDGKHNLVGDRTKGLSTECVTCHTILAQGAGADLSRVAPEGFPFKHPAGDVPDGMLCTGCHNGKNQDN